MPANPLAPKRVRRRHPKMAPEGAKDTLLVSPRALGGIHGSPAFHVVLPAEVEVVDPRRNTLVCPRARAGT
jgi:hypothetical protein